MLLGSCGWTAQSPSCRRLIIANLRCCLQRVQPPRHLSACAHPSCLLPACPQDYVTRSSNSPNLQFQRIMQLFRQRCGARLHWGKAGWPQHAKCFKGSVEYPTTWCHFGCAVMVRAGRVLAAA